MGRFIATVPPVFRDIAVDELEEIDKDLRITDVCANFAIVLETKDADFLAKVNKADPTFVRHIMPADVKLNISGVRERDFPQILRCVESLVKIRKGEDFAVQCRCLGKGRDYNSKDIEVAAGRAIEKMGGFARFAEDGSAKRQILFVFVKESVCYIGFGPQAKALNEECDEYRISSRGEQGITRAEFKLREALRNFKVNAKGRAIDLGSAPGGWAYVLSGLGMEVVAIDPAELHKKVTSVKSIRHIRASFSPDLVDGKFDLAVNDMNIGGVASARIMNALAPKLKTGAWAVMTLKIGIRKLTTKAVMGYIAKALKTLSEEYDVVRIKSLFHNRREVTLLLKRRR